MSDTEKQEPTIEERMEALERRVAAIETKLTATDTKERNLDELLDNFWNEFGGSESEHRNKATTGH